MSYIILRGSRFHIIVLNTHAPTEDRSDDVKDGFYEELERIFNKFPKYHMKFFLVRIYKTIILPVVLYLCETWFLTVREELKLRVFESRMLRRIFGPKRDGVTGWWRKLHNEEIHNLYSWSSIIIIIKSRRMRWAGHVARMGEEERV
jgi:hypothetical protein